jgi:hypothetical protein
MRDSYTGPAMTLGNMRALGVVSIDVKCSCRREPVIDASGWPDAIEIPALRWRLKCAECGAVQSTCARIGRNTARLGTGACKSVGSSSPSLAGAPGITVPLIPLEPLFKIQNITFPATPFGERVNGLLFELTRLSAKLLSNF